MVWLGSAKCGMVGSGVVRHGLLGLVKSREDWWGQATCGMVSFGLEHMVRRGKSWLCEVDLGMEIAARLSLELPGTEWLGKAW